LERAFLDGAVNVAERQRIAVADALVERLEHAARLLGCVRRALHDDVVADRRRDDAEAPLEMRDVLIVEAED
jgi:hypothetical protein